MKRNSDSYTRDQRSEIRGYVDPNLKIIVLRKEFELKYLFE